jgi:hypothetical protein
MFELETGLEALAGRVARHRLKPPVQLGVLIISRFHTNVEYGSYSVPGPPTRSTEVIPFLARQRGVRKLFRSWPANVEYGSYSVPGPPTKRNKFRTPKPLYNITKFRLQTYYFINNN